MSNSFLLCHDAMALLLPWSWTQNSQLFITFIIRHEETTDGGLQHSIQGSLEKHDFSLHKGNRCMKNKMFLA